MTVPQRWLLISNCQTYGLAHSMQLLGDGLTVDPVDTGQYQADTARYNATIGDYDRVLIGLGAQAVPGADFSAARHLAKVPELGFQGYHPDLTYLLDDGAVVNGPIGAYHSMIAFLAHRTGRSQDDTLRLFDGRTYEACGYLDRWDKARDHLVWYCTKIDLDVGEAVRRWGRRTAFMYSNNHPRIHVLYDIARLVMEREGMTPRVSDIMPHDNLALGGTFAVYPEIGEALGVPGSYLFTRTNSYSQIGLRQFVAESFAIYDSHPPGALVPHREFAASFDGVSAMLGIDRIAA